MYKQRLDAYIQLLSLDSLFSLHTRHAITFWVLVRIELRHMNNTGNKI
jgi:hypothetical protein